MGAAPATGENVIQAAEPIVPSWGDRDATLAGPHAVCRGPAWHRLALAYNFATVSKQ